MQLRVLKIFLQLTEKAVKIQYITKLSKCEHFLDMYGIPPPLTDILINDSGTMKIVAYANSN